MPKHIGIVACSVEGAALCYRSIALEALPVMGEHNHPEITLNSIPMAEHMKFLANDDWRGVAALMLTSVRKLAQIGADFAICPDNTIHQALPYVLPESPIPWLHIAEVVAEQASRNDYRSLAVLGTRYLMEGPVYPGALEPYSIGYKIPDPPAREKINTIIFKELVNGIFLDESRIYFNNVMQILKDRGCDAAVLGCTEIPLIVRPEEAPLPTLDSTRLLAKAALQKAIEA
jgi:aspartate racemase